MDEESIGLEEQTDYNRDNKSQLIFNDLLEKKLIDFFIEIKSDASKLEQDDLSATVSKTISNFPTFIINRILFKEIWTCMKRILQQSFDTECLIPFNKSASELDVRNTLLQVVHDFYLHNVFNYVCKSYSICTFNDHIIRKFEIDLKNTVSQRRLPVEQLLNLHFERNISSLRYTLESISKKIVRHLSLVSYTNVCNKILKGSNTEMQDFINSVALNAIWIIDEIEYNFNNTISGLNADGLQQQMQSFEDNGYSSFISIYDLFICKKSKTDLPPMTESCESYATSDDVNDLLLLMIATCVKTLQETHLDKRNILRSINAPLLLNAILCVSLNIADDDSIYAKYFLQQFSLKHMRFEQYLPSTNIILSLFEEYEHPQQIYNAANMALNFMIQFIMRITNYKMVYEIDTEFYERCKIECINLALKMPSLKNCDISQGAADHSEYIPPLILPLHSNMSEVKPNTMTQNSINDQELTCQYTVDHKKDKRSKVCCWCLS